MRARPRPSRGSGSDESSSIALRKAAVASPGVDLRQVGEAEDRLGAGEVRLQGGRLLRRLERRAALAQRRADLGEPRPRERVGGVELDRLLEARACRFEVELRLLRVGQRDLCGGRLRVGGDRLLGAGESRVRTVGRHGDDRLQGEGVGVVRVRLQRLGDVLARVLDAAGGELGGGALGEAVGRTGLQDRRVVERPLNGVERLGAQGHGGGASLGAGRHLAALEVELAGVGRGFDVPFQDGQLGLVAVALDGEAQLGAADRGDRAAAAEAGRPLLPADHVRPDASEEELDVALGGVLVDLDARLGADAQHGAVGEEADAGATLPRDEDVVELERHRRRRRLRLPEPENRDLARGRLECGDRLGGRATRAHEKRCGERKHHSPAGHPVQSSHRRFFSSSPRSVRPSQLRAKAPADQRRHPATHCSVHGFGVGTRAWQANRALSTKRQHEAPYRPLPIDAPARLDNSGPELGPTASGGVRR